MAKGWEGTGPCPGSGAGWKTFSERLLPPRASVSYSAQWGLNEMMLVARTVAGPEYTVNKQTLTAIGDDDGSSSSLLPCIADQSAWCTVNTIQCYLRI